MRLYQVHYWTLASVGNISEYYRFNTVDDTVAKQLAVHYARELSSQKRIAIEDFCVDLSEEILVPKLSLRSLLSMVSARDLNEDVLSVVYLGFEGYMRDANFRPVHEHVKGAQLQGLKRLR